MTIALNMKNETASENEERSRSLKYSDYEADWYGYKPFDLTDTTPPCHEQDMLYCDRGSMYP